MTMEEVSNLYNTDKIVSIHLYESQKSPYFGKVKQWFRWPWEKNDEVLFEVFLGETYTREQLKAKLEDYVDCYFDDIMDCVMFYPYIKINFVNGEEKEIYYKTYEDGLKAMLEFKEMCPTLRIFD